MSLHDVRLCARRGRRPIVPDMATITPRVHIVHDNPQWIAPFAAAFDAAGIPHQEWLLGEGTVDLDAPPPSGVFWSRLSASAHTRDRARAKEQGRAILRWAESWGRPVVNGSRALELEVSKAAQHSALRAHGIEVPRTVVAFTVDDAVRAAESLGFPLIVKHNQGGKGLGVHRVDTAGELAQWAADPDAAASPDGIVLVQELLRTATPSITRAEFVGGEFLYAVRVDTSGGFELCPAEACAVADAPAPFALRADIDAQHPLIASLTGFLREHGIAIAGVEFAETIDGRAVVYDINTNTNYNPDVEAQAARGGADAVAAYLGALLTSSR